MAPVPVLGRAVRRRGASPQPRAGRVRCPAREAAAAHLDAARRSAAAPPAHEPTAARRRAVRESRLPGADRPRHGALRSLRLLEVRGVRGVSGAGHPRAALRQLRPRGAARLPRLRAADPPRSRALQRLPAYYTSTKPTPRIKCVIALYKSASRSSMSF